MPGLAMSLKHRAAFPAIGLFLLLLTPARAAVADAALADLCAVPSEFSAEIKAKLPRLAERIKAGQAVKIAAVGGSSTAGAAASSPSRTYPHQLEDDLKARHPGLQITVLNRGAPRESAEEMVQRIEREVIPENPDLVLWETGITDAVRGINPDAFTDAVQSGIDKLRRHNIDIILIDMQYSRRITSVIDFERYLDALHGAADVNGLYIFPRYEIMAHWSESGRFDFDNVPENDRANQAAMLYSCIALHLADAIDSATR